MRYTITIDETLLAEAMELVGARTRSEAVDAAMRELIRVRRLQRMAERIGTDRISLTLKELRQLRRLA